ncbi:unnamed protein product [Miscanthus lutarioriparius]|uniref:CTLH domain-containing protein n=1 Tax=Miscanthus lutarioriparius TaxID=422564 RepID=A0A811NAU3_9POAL|nr:unnamed protein product [Miscanthus lutarioriparius]
MGFLEPCFAGLEQESGFYFNLKHFEDLVQGGEWDELERYLSGFTKLEDNRYSMKIFFEIRKQKYLEALDRHNRAKAVEILVKDLKVFASFNEELFKEITQLLTLENFSATDPMVRLLDPSLSQLDFHQWVLMLHTNGDLHAANLDNNQGSDNNGDHASIM